ncbi:MAG: flavodoxin-dependent (E)-4-hydroxy-3-methylbut-2-enyl-diphosphate synthase, partial [Chlamydiota bacterium]
VNLVADLERVVTALRQAGIQIVTHAKDVPGTLPLYDLEQTKAIHDSSKPYAIAVRSSCESQWEALKNLKPAFIFFSPESSRLHTSRKFFDWLRTNALETPVIFDFDYALAWDDLVIEAATEIGALLADGLGEGVCIRAQGEIEALRCFSFNLLQAARMRTSKTEYISCPGCGRTLFDLQSVAKRIRERTGHLPGVKVAIMGCIVNGPGEMADADFGYVGSRPGKVDLYVGKTCVEKGIEFAEADGKLIELIKAHGRWQEPEVEEALASSSASL